MKNKARNRRTVKSYNTGEQGTKGMSNKEEREIQSKVSLELIIFRTIFAAIVVGFAVYGFYTLNVARTSDGLNTNDIVDTRSEEDSFVELDSDNEDPEVKAPINGTQHKEKTTEKSKNIKEHKNNAGSENSGSNIQSSSNTDSKTITPSAKQLNAPKTQTDKNKQQSLPKDAKHLKSEAESFKPTYLKKMSPKKIFVDGRRLPPIELLAQKPNNSSVR
jgi:hypothetical protein